ncbi:hypothetical protein HY383_02310 [Candidatus Daviesbacteria bacterium]|nr:hypothetical protein [Candidatus Daviesbacteria bacterium]
MISTVKTFTAGLFILLFTLTLGLKPVWAEELIISGNGENSQNAVSVTTNTDTTIEQSNNTQITNDVNLSADTGSNQTSDNSGGATITTGDATEQSTIENSASSSQVTSECCLSPTPQAIISANGSDSTNSITANQTNQTEVTVSQTANINNTTDGQANTGGNEASSNGGNVSINTGNINAEENIQNSSINSTDITIPQGGRNNWSASISDNGSDSTNSINLDLINQNSITINNEANIENNSHWNLNTGGNFANGNLGDVAITTGDIDFSSAIENAFINISEVALICCAAPSPSPSPSSSPSPSPSPNPSGGENNEEDPPEITSSISGGGSAGASGEPSEDAAITGAVLGASALGEVLAAAGNAWLLLLTILALLSLVVGLYFRFGPLPKIQIKRLKFAL